MRGFFDHITYGDQLSSRKPNPEMLYHAMAALGTESCLFVEMRLTVTPQQRPPSHLLFLPRDIEKLALRLWLLNIISKTLSDCRPLRKLLFVLENSKLTNDVQTKFNMDFGGCPLINLQ